MQAPVGPVMRVATLATSRGTDPKAEGAANGRVCAMVAKEAIVDPRYVTGTFLINNIYATVLFDSGAEWSFVNHQFRKLITYKSQPLKDTYIVAMANGQL